MKDSFEKIIDEMNRFNLLIEDMLNVLPDTGKNYKLKTKVESAHRSLKRSMLRHESLITDQVPKVNSKMDNYPVNFVNTWNVYKDFLIEQFGIRMGSRMQLYRLILLFDLTDNNFDTAAQWLRYYMAAGSSNIYFVKEVKPEEETNEQKGKIGFTLPAAG